MRAPRARQADGAGAARRAQRAGVMGGTYANGLPAPPWFSRGGSYPCAFKAFSWNLRWEKRRRKKSGRSALTTCRES